MKKKRKKSASDHSVRGKCLYVIGVSARQESESGPEKELKWARAHAPERVETIEKSHQQGKDYINRKLENIHPEIVLIDRGCDYFPESHLGMPREKEKRWQENLFAARWAKENNVPVKLVGLAEMCRGPEDKVQALRAEKIAVQARDRFLSLASGNICLFVEKGLLDEVCAFLPDIHPVKRTTP